MLKTAARSVCAGILIAIGGSIFLSLKDQNNIIAAVLFSVALLCICYREYFLFTGKVGYIVESHKGSDVANLLIGLVGNLVTTFLLGLLIRYAIPAQGAVAETLCQGKLDSQALWQTFVRAVFCGFLMYLAVSILKDKSTPLGIIYGIPVFILAGFEHSIADMFYFGASGIYTGKAFLFVLIVVLGNSVGGMLLPLLQKVGVKQA